MATLTLDSLTRLLSNYQIEQPYLEALNLLELTTRLSRTKVLAGDFQLSPDENTRLQHLVEQRRHLPLAYLKGEKEFYRLNFYIDENTLIPRPESEDLITLALGEEKAFTNVYDVGSGSGCLGISYGYEQLAHNTLIHFLDCSYPALTVAQKNCQRHAIQKTNFIHKDIRHLARPYFKAQSLLFANLPYLDNKLRQTFEKNCPSLKSEPTTALYATQGGLKLYHVLFHLCRSQNLTIVCESLKNQQVLLDTLAGANGFRLKTRLNLASLFISASK